MRLFHDIAPFAMITLVSAASALSSSSSSISDLNGWYPCSDVTFADEGILANQFAECAIYTAPLCYPSICENSESVETTTVDIFVKRLTARNDSDTASNVWFMQGGPGYSSSDMELLMMELYVRLGGTVNVYTMDHRGTGRSTLLDCVAAQVTTTGSPLGSDIDATEVPACAGALEKKYGNLASFSTTSAATDLATFISDYSNGASTIVYGVSYGTALVERLIHLDVPEVTGYVLDGIATTSGASGNKFEYFSRWDADFGEVGEAFMALCSTQSECSDRFPSSDLSTTLMSLVTDFDSNPNSTCAALVSVANSDSTDPPSYSLRNALGSLLQSSSTRTLIPPVVYRLNRCASQDIDVLNHFFTTLNTNDEAPDEGNAYYSSILYNLIVFSEMWETPEPSSSEMLERFTGTTISDGGTYTNIQTYCSFSKENSTVCNEFDVGSYSANGIIYEHDEYWNKSATIPAQASVLLLSGKLDPQTPHKYAEYLLEALNGDQKELITFDYATHGTLSTTSMVDWDPNSETCGMKLLVSYVNNSGDLNSLDKSCVSMMPAFNLTVQMDNLYSYLSVHDAYDGVYEASLSSSESQDTSVVSTAQNSSSNYKDVFIVFAALFAVVLAVAGFTLHRLRKLKKGKSSGEDNEDIENSSSKVADKEIVETSPSEARL